MFLDYEFRDLLLEFVTLRNQRIQFCSWNIPLFGLLVGKWRKVL
jgi:hypothetical protein